MCAEVRVCDNTPGAFGKWRFMWCGWEVERGCGCVSSLWLPAAVGLQAGRASY